MSQRRFVIVVFAFLLSGAISCSTPPLEIVDSEAKLNEPLFRDFEPTAEHPFGRPNPRAPEELAQFEFLIGEFDAQVRRRLPDGSWFEEMILWQASYILNGHAIQDRTWSDTAATTSIRFFDTNQGKWRVSYQAKPGNIFGFVWEGVKSDDQMVLTSTYPNGDGDAIFSRLTFHDITPTGFEWTSEETNQRTGETLVDWTISARRRL
ncbi:MAG: hypothetical protein AAF604_11430 [Acidobacteriota bacterium]